MRAQLDEQCVINANTQFWEQMLAMSLDPMLCFAEFSAAAGHLLGSVKFSGAWKGHIEVRMEATLAYHATSAMMMQPIESVAEADALDAAKEIANMIAGTIKSSLPRPCAMSVPESAVEGGEYKTPPSAADTLVVAFHHAAGDLMVRVWEQESL